MGAPIEGIRNPTRPISLSQRASLPPFTVTTTRCETARRTPLLPIRCCGAQRRVPSTGMEATVLDMARRKAHIHSAESKTEGGPTTHHRTTLTATVPTPARNHTPIKASQPTGLTSQQTTGQSISVLLGRNITTTVELRFLNGRNPKTCWRESRDRRTPPRWHPTVSPRTGTTDKRPCKTELQPRALQLTSLPPTRVPPSRPPCPPPPLLLRA